MGIFLCMYRSRLRSSPRFEVHHRSSRRPQQLRLPLLSHLSSPSDQCDGLEQLWRPLTQHKSISCAATLVAAGFGNDLRQAPNPHQTRSPATAPSRVTRGLSAQALWRVLGTISRSWTSLRARASQFNIWLGDLSLRMAVHRRA